MLGSGPPAGPRSESGKLPGGDIPSQFPSLVLRDLGYLLLPTNGMKGNLSDQPH